MPLKKLKLVTLILIVTVIAFLLPIFVEWKSVIGKSSTRSPDGDWCLNLRLVEYATLFSSRKILDADIKHIKNKNWDVSTSIPLDDADARTISNQHPDHPIVWSDDSTTVNYWVNDHFEDFMCIKVEAGQHTFQRGLYSTTVTKSADTTGS